MSAEGEPRQPLKAEHPEPPPPLGGTVDTPSHEPGWNDRVPRLAPRARRVVWAVVGLAIAGAVLWAGGELGWQRSLAVISTALLCLGLLAFYGRPSEIAVAAYRRENPARTSDELTRQVRDIWKTTGVTLCLVGVGGWIVAIFGG
jgi:hypothetical protein